MMGKVIISKVSISKVIISKVIISKAIISRVIISKVIISKVFISKVSISIVIASRPKSKLQFRKVLTPRKGQEHGQGQGQGVIFCNTYFLYGYNTAVNYSDILY
jgi:hypothetical protein